MNGYYRMNDSLVESCIQCDCNGRADTCDTPTGTCINCTNNYDGDHCEDCLHGYYLNGMDCIPCDCDGQSCDTNGTCINCTIGYRGLQCDTCENGYYVCGIAMHCNILLIILFNRIILVAVKHVTAVVMSMFLTIPTVIQGQESV